jgi:hypothetical protein
MRNPILFILSTLLFPLSCTESPPPTKITKWSGKLAGTWESSAFRVTINTANNSDSTYQDAISEDEWASRMKMKPIESYFQQDNKYIAEYRNLGDSLVRRHRGIWNIFGDSLVIIEPDAIYQYTLSREGDRVLFKSMVDWDGDGKEDDEYIGIYKKR